jgi:hypothetical protein
MEPPTSRAVTGKAMCLRTCAQWRDPYAHRNLPATSARRGALDVTRRDETIASGSHDPDRGDVASIVRPCRRESRALTPLNGCDHWADWKRLRRTHSAAVGACRLVDHQTVAERILSTARPTGTSVTRPLSDGTSGHTPAVAPPICSCAERSGVTPVRARSPRISRATPEAFGTHHPPTC